MRFTESAKRVFKFLADHGEATRPQIADALSLSKPTLSTVMGELESFNFVHRVSEVQGHTGRKAGMYQLYPDAGLVIGIDAGSTRVSLSVSTLDKRILFSSVKELEKSQSELNEKITEVAAELLEGFLTEKEEFRNRIRKIGIAVPARVKDRHQIDDILKPLKRLTRSASPFGFVVENNVNCAAIAEKNYGVARALDNFAYVQIGVKIGMGLFLNGELIRGENGATGELSWIPYPLSPTDQPVKFELENYLSADRFSHRAQSLWAELNKLEPAPLSLQDVFARAASGDLLALQIIKGQAEQIGRLVATCIAIADPGFVVLGGGVGKNAMLAPLVQSEVDTLSVPTKIITSSMGDDATLSGILELCRQEAVDELICGDFSLSA